jgi:GDP-L-fucose synthase
VDEADLADRILAVDETTLPHRELAETVSRVTGFKGKLVFDATKPDGTKRKLMDVSRLKSLGWEASTSLEDGLRLAYDWFVTHQDESRI